MPNSSNKALHSASSSKTQWHIGIIVQPFDHFDFFGVLRMMPIQRPTSRPTGKKFTVRGLIFLIVNFFLLTSFTECGMGD
jgi:hypothetical protein